jgi:hypothetical protein
MNSCRVFFNEIACSIVALLLTPAFQSSCAGRENAGIAPKRHMDMIRRVYEFDKWAGKVKVPDRRVSKLEIDPNFFNGIATKTRVFTAEPNRASELDLNMADRDSGLNVSVDITVTTSPEKAHSYIISYLSVVTIPAPAFRRVDPNDPNDSLNIGDVCFVPIESWVPRNSRRPVIRTLMFCRNNVFVILRNSGDETKEVYPDLCKIALLIDRRLKETSKPTK